MKILTDTGLMVLWNKIKQLVLGNRPYNPSEFSGKGYKVLEKNIQTVGGVKKNILTAIMLSEANTIYEIRYDFDLGDETIEMQEGCTLKFCGGSLKNGTINGNGSRIDSGENIIFDNVSLNNITSEGIFPEWFGKLGSNDSALIQQAIDIATSNDSCVFLNNKYSISETIKITRVTDGVKDHYLTIKGCGEINATKDIPLFSSSEIKDVPNTQFLVFENITFKGSKNSFVLNGNNIFRTHFIKCSFHIRLLESDKYIQSIYFSNCLMRHFYGTWLKATGGCYDIKFNQCSFDAAYNATACEFSAGSVHLVTNVSFVQCLIENLLCGIKYDGVNSLSFIGNYFEDNKEGSIISNGDKINNGISIIGNYFKTEGKDNTNGNGFYDVIWGNTYAGVSCANYCDGDKFHYMKSSQSDILIRESLIKGSKEKISNVSEKLVHNVWYGDELPNINGAIVNYTPDIIPGDIIINTGNKSSCIGWMCTAGGRYDGAEWIPIGKRYSVINGKEDLNDFITSGVWFPEKTNAREWNTEGTNYPVSKAGILSVDANNAGTYIKQTYTLVMEQKQGSIEFVRTYYAYGGRWSDWSINGYSIGSTNDRPVLDTHLRIKGMLYFDTDINRLIVWNGTAWVNTDGTELMQ